MNPWKQFWTLLRFQASANPLLWCLLPVAFIPLFLSTSPYSYFSLDNYLSLGGSYLVIFVAIFTLMPELLFANQRSAGLGGNFLLTYAIDRRILCRTKSTLFYLVMLAGPAATLIASLFRSDLRIHEYFYPQQILAHVPHSSMLHQASTGYGQEDQILIPHGWVLVAEWHLLQGCLLAALAQYVVWLVAPLRHAPFILWALYIGCPLLPLFSLLFPHHTYRQPTLTEQSFFLFLTHPLPILAGAFVLTLVCQRWSERRFCRIEF